MANAALASRKDGRDAVVAARKGQAAWASATPYNRGQVMYRMAEMMEARRAELAEALRAGCGVSPAQASHEVDLAVDTLVHHAGWTDKLATVMGSVNAVSSPFFSYSTPEPTGVVVVVPPGGAGLLGLVSVVAPVVAGGNAAIAMMTPEGAPIASAVAEILATSDVPAGVVNILTGAAAEVLPHLAAHGDVNGLDLTGADTELRAELGRVAAETVKRVYVPRRPFDPEAAPGTARLRAFLEIKTVWHPTGAPSLAGASGY
jgi:aldehyde dehydrogenase (NAD+)